MKFMFTNACSIILNFMFAHKSSGTVQDEFYAIYDAPGRDWHQMQKIERWYDITPDARDLLCKCLGAQESDFDKNLVLGLPDIKKVFSVRKDEYLLNEHRIVICGNPYLATRKYYYALSNDVHDYFVLKNIRNPNTDGEDMLKPYAKVSIPRKEEVKMRDDEYLGKSEKAGFMDAVPEHCSEFAKLLQKQYNPYNKEHTTNY